MQPGWRALLRQGDAGRALAALQRQPGGIDAVIASAGSAAELMDLSDVLRSRGGDRAAAIRALTRVVDSFARDANAPLAAFTLGRIHEQGGEPALAAGHYERAENLAPDGGIAESALCARIRAELLGGKPEEARRAGKAYAERYPGGACDAQRILAGEEGDAPPPLE
jgi:tetratricopeptide (TPR) repeat protein